MKKIFLEAHATLGKVEFETKTLPKKVGIVTTIQHLSEMKKIVDYLWTKGVKAVVGGQVLGCDATSAEKIKDDVDAFLYVGSGEFHPIGVALKTGKQVFVLHPESMRITKVDPADVEKINRKKMGMLAKFHASKTIGVLMTTKEGQGGVQGGIKKVKQLEKKYPAKKFYYFICDTLEFSQLENFNFIECWVNTMCPRIMEDIKVLNVQDILAVQ
jgi:2-(3-amino-3-carboxypropyl)histidine synthase